MRRSRQPVTGPQRVLLGVESLEERDLMAANAIVAGTTLQVFGTAQTDNIAVVRDAAAGQLVVQDFGREILRIGETTVAFIQINARGGNDLVFVGPGVAQNAILNAGRSTPAFSAGGDTLVYLGNGVAILNGGPGNDVLQAGPGISFLNGGPGNDQLLPGTGVATATGGPGRDRFYGIVPGVNITDPTPEDHLLTTRRIADIRFTPFLGLPETPPLTLAASEVQLLLDRASAATTSRDAIIVITDRSGRILGVRVEDGVDPAIQNDVFQRVFAIDGALALSRIAAFFGNNQAPLTSRTFQTTSQTTLTEREIRSNPNISDVNSTLRGPGFVGPQGLGNHFPPGVAFTPQVDQFAIEHTNRDSIFAVGADNVRGSNNGFGLGDDVRLLQRFNVNPAFIPDRLLNPSTMVDPQGRSITLAPPDSYGVLSGLMPGAQGRGLGTLPGGVPIYKRDPGTGQLLQVGGMGVFFPGKTGFASEENSSLSADYDPTKPDRSIEAELIAFTALGGVNAAGLSFQGALGDSQPLPTVNVNGKQMPQFQIIGAGGRVDLVGITLDVFGPKGLNGPNILLQLAPSFGTGAGAVNGTNQPLIDPGQNNIVDSVDATGTTGDDAGVVTLLNGTIAPEGFLVEPHASADGLISADDVRQIIFQGVQQALITRAAIRLPFDSPARFMLTVTSKSGEVLGQFRMPDATIFSVDVSTAKARNVAYYADPAALQPIDSVPGAPAGAAFTARTFRFLALPRFPEGIDGNPPGPFSQLNSDPGIDRTTLFIREPVQPQDLFRDVVGTGAQVGPRLPAMAFAGTVLGFNAFFPGTNFHDFRTNGVTDPNNPLFFQNNLLNRDGIVFFPGSAPLYKDTDGDGVKELIGGFGISGDGVDQDDITTAGGFVGFEVPTQLRADQFFVGGVRLPFQKFNRQPNINPFGSSQLGSSLQQRVVFV